MNDTNTTTGNEIMAVSDDAIRELCTLTTRDEGGQHFTYWSMHWESLEAAGLIEIDRPVHVATGLAYGQDEWELQATDAGLATVKANPKLHPRD